MRDLLVLGEALVDVVHRDDGTVAEHPGGSSANVAVALARLGHRVRLGTAWGPDDHGRLLAAHLAADGVALAADPVVLERTARAVAHIGADGSATYDFDLEWRLPEPAPADSPLAVVTGSIGAVLAPGAAQVAAVVERLRASATVVFDVNARPAITGTGPEVVAAVERAARAADLVKASDEDLAALWPGRSLEASATALRALGPAAVVVTRGAAGIGWLGDDVTTEVPAPVVEVDDTIGAGDTVTAALVDALAGRDLLGGRLPALSAAMAAEVLAHAARAAAVTVSRPGADPPYRSELA